MHELAQVTDVTPRTIRFYVAEGLLPPPAGAGPAAVYTAAHRDRLRLIGVLKARYLPLKEIRRQVATLTDEEVHARLQEERPTMSAAPVPTGQNTGAVAYHDRVLDQLHQPTPLSLPGAPSAPRPVARERWERIVLADGVELHVREEWQRAVGPIDALIRQARKLLGAE